MHVIHFLVRFPLWNIREGSWHHYRTAGFTGSNAVLKIVAISSSVTPKIIVLHPEAKNQLHLSAGALIIGLGWTRGDEERRAA